MTIKKKFKCIRTPGLFQGAYERGGFCARTSGVFDVYVQNKIAQRHSIRGRYPPETLKCSWQLHVYFSDGSVLTSVFSFNFRPLSWIIHSAMAHREYGQPGDLQRWRQSTAVSRQCHPESHLKNINNSNRHTFCDAKRSASNRNRCISYGHRISRRSWRDDRKR